MTKFGVGVGEEFPVDEQNRPQQESGTEGDREGCRWGRRDHRAGHDAWHQFRDQMRAEWRARRRAFRDSMGSHDGADVIDDLRAHHVHKFLIGGLALIGLAALLSLFQSRR